MTYGGKLLGLVVVSATGGGLMMLMLVMILILCRLLCFLGLYILKSVLSGSKDTLFRITFRLCRCKEDSLAQRDPSRQRRLPFMIRNSKGVLSHILIYLLDKTLMLLFLSIKIS